MDPLTFLSASDFSFVSVAATSSMAVGSTAAAAAAGACGCCFCCCCCCSAGGEGGAGAGTLVCGTTVSATLSSLLWFGLSGVFVVALVVAVVVVAAAAAAAVAAVGRLLLGWDCSLESRDMDVGVPGTAKPIIEWMHRNIINSLDNLRLSMSWLCSEAESSSRSSWSAELRGSYAKLRMKIH